mmetsp:Transcript_8396/g.24496  ORF Transcript_8396/g.24496 Transcript_8396/m.24496 type:complete len:112 (-) Transcript_8396:249-584(-)
MPPRCRRDAAEMPPTLAAPAPPPASASTALRLPFRYRARQGPLERLVERATDLVLPRPPYIRRGLARLVKPLQAYPAASYVAHRRQETGYAGAIWEGWAEARDEGGNRYYD